MLRSASVASVPPSARCYVPPLFGKLVGSLRQVNCKYSNVNVTIVILWVTKNVSEVRFGPVLKFFFEPWVAGRLSLNGLDYPSVITRPITELLQI